MTLWNHLGPDDLPRAGSVPGELANGTRIKGGGIVSFVRSGFARVRWADGSVTDEWGADLAVEESP